MAEPAKEVKNTVVEIEGLEDVFEADCKPIAQSIDTVLATFEQCAERGAKQGAGMSLKAACIHYKLAPSTLRMKIKRGEIPAKKIQGANGPEWRIFSASSEFGDRSKQGADQSVRHGVNTVQAGYQNLAQVDISRLLNVIERQSAKLESAAGQIGYLKSQLDTYQEQLKLLPDLQARAAQLASQEARAKEIEVELERIKTTWWHRFFSWFQ